MAYAALISLKHTIERLVHSSHILLVSRSTEIIDDAYLEVESLEMVLEELDSTSVSSSRKRVNALDEQIRQAVSKFEDLLESHVSDMLLSQSENINGDGIQFSIDLQDLERDIRSFTKKAMKLARTYRKVLNNMLPEKYHFFSSRIDYGGKKSKMVGLSDRIDKLRTGLTSLWGLDFVIFSIVGMAGIGKTAIAKEIFEDPLILSHFNCRAWVTVGRKCQLKEIPRVILAQANPNTDHKMLIEGEDEVVGSLYKSLKGRRYVIVLDDVWNTEVCCYLKCSFPDNNNGSRVLLTTRLQKVAQDYTHHFQSDDLEMRLLHKEESWDLFREKVFAEELCPPELVKVGKSIAEKCEGLPLTIVTIARILSKAEKTPKYWSNVADQKQNSVFMDAYNKISKVLYPSYEYLPQHLKMCFLYMGVFPQNSKISRSKLINMWIAEGFLEPNYIQTLEDYASECLKDLVSNSLVMAYQKSTIWSHSIKVCGLHSSFWHLCNREARKNKSFHLLNSWNDGSAKGIKSQRRLCTHNNILFSIKDVINSMEEGCASTAHSLLCFGPYSQYPVQICCNLRLLRVVDALSIRFYEFPMEVLKLSMLRYLGLTYNGKLPSSISRLLNLQFLFVHRHLSIKSFGAPSYLPMEIWDMKELKHLHIMGSNIPNPYDASLQNLVTLLDVSIHSCTKQVFKRIPNLKKLGIQIELAPDDDRKPLSCLNHIYRLHRLESLKCVVVNPRCISVSPSTPLSMFPSGLQKLHLSGLGYSWDYMRIIGLLPLLKVLKLRHYAFQGSEWEVQENTFMRLQFLLIEDTDLVQWKVGHGSFPKLRCLRMKKCYKLEELHWEYSATFFRNIELVDCNPLVETCLKQIKEAYFWKGFYDPYVYMHSSWNDRNLKT